MIHGNCTIGDCVQIHHQKSIGRVAGYRAPLIAPITPIIVCDDFMLLPGAELLGGTDGLHVGRGTIGANADLLQSTEE